MSDNNGNTSSGGIGVLGLLQVAFIVLKILGKITWSWLWVLAPTWIPVAIVLFVLLVLFIIATTT